jgi:single-strand DNA-binding protein
MGVNKVILLGRLGKDPEVRYTSQQFPICNFSLATSERRKDQNGEWKDTTEWHNIVVLGKSGENCQKFIKKGSEVYIEGKIQTRKWQDKEGKDRYTTEILAGTVQFLGGKGATGGAYQDAPNSGGGEGFGGSVLDSLPSADQLAASADSVSFDDDDIPF